MRLIAILFVAVCIMVPIGFYFQATGNYRGRGRLEAPARVQFTLGDIVELKTPIAVCDKKALCAEARRMTQRLKESTRLGKSGDLINGEAWFEQMAKEIKFASKVRVLEPDSHFTRVVIADGSDQGFEGFVYTVGLEEEAVLGEPAEAPVTHHY